MIISLFKCPKNTKNNSIIIDGELKPNIGTFDRISDALQTFVHYLMRIVDFSAAIASEEEQDIIC